MKLQLPLDVHADIRQAHTPPAALYTDAAVFEKQVDRIFARTWHYAADRDAVRVPGQTHPFTLLPGCLDEALLLTRDREDRLHCISNVCTHRGMLVCEAGGNERSLRCRYHGRRFSLAGKFESMPEFEQTANFPSPQDDLQPVPFGSLGPLLLAALRPQMTLEELLAPLRARLDWMPLEQARFDAARSRDYLVQCNWALYCENYLEGFHIPFVHNSLNQALDYASYRTELFRYGSVQIGVASGGEHAFEIPPGRPDHGSPVAGYYFWLFPATMLNFYPWGLSLNVVRPLAVDRTRVSFLSYVWDEALIDQGAGAALDRVEREDEAIVEAVQRALRSRIYARGRYSPTREQGTHHFHRLLAEFLT